MRSILLATLTTVLLATGSTITQAQSVSDTQAQIKALLEKVAALQAQLQQLNSSSCNFNRDLFFGIRGDDVKCLQQYLSVTNTGFFGPLTKSAIENWQAKNNISPASGYFGPISRKKYQQLTVPTPAPISSPSPTPAPAPTTPAQPTPPTAPTSSIKTGSGIVANNGLLKIETGSFLYNGSGIDNRGYFFPGDPEAFIADRSSFEDVSSCESTKAYSYRGISNICQFTDPMKFNFIKLTTDGVRFYDKAAYKSSSPCNTGIMVFKQNNLYGAIDFESVDKENNLHYSYWIDQSGGTNFGSLCSAQSNASKMASLLDNLKSVLRQLQGAVR